MLRMTSASSRNAIDAEIPVCDFEELVFDDRSDHRSIGASEDSRLDESTQCRHEDDHDSREHSRQR